MSNSVSRQVVSNQIQVFAKLDQLVKKHQHTEFKKPIAEFNLAAFQQAQNFYQASGAPLILDSGCGIGQSSYLLARKFPDYCVLGIDRSADRLERNLLPSLGAQPENLLLVRADLVDFWRLAVEAGWQAAYHFLLYPNPYPKQHAIKQRWHGHPVFKYLLALGGKFESRTNWHIYAQELQQALQLSKHAAQLQAFTPTAAEYLTPFERKYAQSGHQLWQVTAQLS